jgi:hypothetical protein
MHRCVLLAGSFVAFAAGCASAPSQDQWRSAAAAVQTAEAAGASEHAASSETLRLATTELQRASKADPGTASRMVTRARVDARLAQAQARRDSARKQVEEIAARTLQLETVR